MILSTLCYIETEDGEIAPATAALPSRLSDEQVRKMI